MKMEIRRLIITSLIICSGVTQASIVLAQPDCQKAAQIFLKNPNKSNMLALGSGNGSQCWQVIGDSNANLGELLRSVRKGNFWAASYLAANTKALGGGNLEDSLIALGQFSDVDMEDFLIFAQNGILSEQEFDNALTMLPLSMSDDQVEQLSAMRVRAKNVEKINRKDLLEQKSLALKAIDAFISEIEATKSGG